MDEKKTVEELKPVETPVVVLGGRTYELRLGHKAMKHFCRQAKCTMTGFDRALDSFDNQELLLWCILQAQDPSVTREAVADYLDGLLLEDEMNLLQEVTAAALPSTAGRELQRQRAALAEEKATEGQENPTTPETTSGTA